MKRTAVVHFEDAIHKIVSSDPGFQFDSEYYASPDFAARPNSTLRLNLVNYVALRKLSKVYPIDIFHYSEVNGQAEDLLDYEQVVINTVASKRTESLVKQLMPLMDASPTPPNLIIGTEYSWTNNVKNGNIPSDIVESLYKDYLILRHTARTDRHLYDDASYRDSRVQEFELGIRMDALPEPLPVEQRKGILFVAAPEGRLTKNNDEIYELAELFAASEIGNGHEIQIINPPYTAAQYWAALRSARYLIFTSRGETFSYVLNDALSMGVIAFRKPELFATRVGQFGADAYWDVGLRYRNADDLIQRMKSLSADRERLAIEAYRASAISTRRFSSESVERNWRLLLGGGSLNRESMLVADIGAFPGGVEEAFRRARDLECSIVVAYMSRGLDRADLTSYSLTNEDRTIAILPYCYQESGESIRAVSPDLGNGKLVEEADSNVILDYLRLVVRVNGVSRAFVDPKIHDPVLSSILGQVRYLEGNALAPLLVQPAP